MSHRTDNGAGSAALGGHHRVGRYPIPIVLRMLDDHRGSQETRGATREFSEAHEVHEVDRFDH
jgi:hypothetical protein